MTFPEVDLVIAFRATKKTSLSKSQIRADSRKAEQQYSRLIDTLTYAGLKAVGRRGESLGHLLVFVSCPQNHVNNLIKRERHSDFLSGLPTTPVAASDDIPTLSSADRLRLVHAFVTSMPADGGLGIAPGSSEWDLVESIMALHDREFNEAWIRNWTPRHIASVQLDKIREQFGDSVALYFAFLSSYTKALIIPALLGITFYFFGTPYSPTYSTLVFVWSVIFVEWWRVRERILSLRFGTRGSFRVEKRRAEYIPGFSWWKRELRMVASLPVLLLFAGILVALLTGIFVFEAFVTQLYTGPGHQFISFSPTILFVALVPRFLAIYQYLAKVLTRWENHAHFSTHTASLTLKTFALSALVAYLGLALSAFVYVPFGEGVMQLVQVWLFQETTNGHLKGTTNSTTTDGFTEEKVAGPTGGFWDMDTTNARLKLNPGRLRDQMFAYTVTNQIINTFVEVGLPFILRRIAAFRDAKKAGMTPGSPGEKNGVKKRVVFEDEKEKGGMEEREFLDGVRAEAALPEYELFGDYSEMVTQFGYVAMWSTIWPLAPVMALLNNFLELRSDAFKMTVHNRRPIPARTDTIGPWLDTLTFLTWLSALTNSSLVYLFCPRSQSQCSTTPSGYMSQLDKVHQHLFSASGVRAPDSGADQNVGATRELLMTALLIALAASHGYMILRVIIRHIVEMLVWKGSEEVIVRERDERSVKEKFLAGVTGDEEAKTSIQSPLIEDRVEENGKRMVPNEEGADFWDNDEGLEEIMRVSKEV
ncbi:calcium-activated chloride channel-domain-containing protein [Collybia nuda]|uniref:Calcium-activated chloride channel-domain-containing protein n=1 Tax=Collybia nuda TaxID=64659 RepID=A0A9P5Y397_9AGAR|nr:calcium-activated chloride channel-domain-containing protein [Collybia nuda]